MRIYDQHHISFNQGTYDSEDCVMAQAYDDAAFDGSKRKEKCQISLLKGHVACVSGKEPEGVLYSAISHDCYI